MRAKSTFISSKIKNCLKNEPKIRKLLNFWRKRWKNWFHNKIIRICEKNTMIWRSKWVKQQWFLMKNKKRWKGKFQIWKKKPNKKLKLLRGLLNSSNANVLSKKRNFMSRILCSTKKIQKNGDNWMSGDNHLKIFSKKSPQNSLTQKKKSTKQSESLKVNSSAQQNEHFRPYPI